jgi:hypothetical protein
VGDRRAHPTRSLAAAATALVLGLAGIGVAFIEPSAGAASARRRAEPQVRAARVPLDAAVAARARVEAEQAMREAQIARDRATLAAYVAEFYRPKTGVNWDGIARCETGGNWSMRGPEFSGGVGFYNGTWNSFGGRQFASNAGLATREQQIVVAERVYARYGLSGWGCKAYG